MGAHNFFLEDDIEGAFGYLKNSLRISGEIKDLVSELMGNYWMAVALAYNCEFDKALSLFDKALRINEASNSLWGTSIMKSSISYFIHYFRGDMDVSHKMSLEAVDLAKESGDNTSKAMAYASHGSACYGKGAMEEAVESLTKSIEACERANMSSWNASVHYCLGETFFDLGSYEASKDYYERAILILEENKMFPSWTNMNRIALARAKVRQSGEGIDPRPFIDYITANKVRLCEGPMARYIGEILFNIDDRNTDIAEEWIQKAMHADRKNGLMLHLGRDHRLHADLLFRKREKHAAMNAIKRSTEIFNDCCALKDLEEAETVMASY